LIKHKNEPLIIDMRNATGSELLALTRLLTMINTLVSSHGLSIQIRKGKQNPLASTSSRAVTLS
jgi:hypothetical protein